MYKNQEWGPICDAGFSYNDVQIACQQMGFTSGIIVNNVKAKIAQLDEDSKIRFAASNVNCTGKEAKISQCNIRYHDIICKHDQDVVIVCSGNGDPSGKSQYIKKPPTPDPKLGKLLFPFRQITCQERGEDMLFRGDPGSLYIVNCPRGCNNQGGNVWGNGIYSSDSFICRSAIHAGVIDFNGGDFGFVVSFEQEKLFTCLIKLLADITPSPPS